MAESFREGVSAISFYGGARWGSRTMLHALIPASVAIPPSLATLANVQGAASAARTGADKTSKMPAAAMISFNAFDQFHPTMAPQCNSNNNTYP
jgi:dihydroxyacetone kinase